MATFIRPRFVPKCSACLQRFAWANSTEVDALAGISHQQVRWARRLPNNSGTVNVRLRKDTPTYGKKGAIVPVVTGQMRNVWFPRRVADYVPRADLKMLRETGVSMERDYLFGVKQETPEMEIGSRAGQLQQGSLSDAPEMQEASMFRKSAADFETLSADRIAGLVDIFIPRRLDFYRQPIIDATGKPETPEIRGVSSAANDLMAARLAEKKAAQSIYGSVSTQEVLTAVKAAMAENDEASRVVIHGEDVRFVNLPELEGSNAERVKHTGEFVVEIKPVGVETAIQRTVRVIAQEA